MAIVAESFTCVVGVDTHARTHTLAVVTAATGAVVATATFPTSPAGLARAVTWITKRAVGPTLVVIEGIGSYGASLARKAADAGFQVVEAHVTGPREATGKDDTQDAIRIARTITGQDLTQLRHPRADQGIRAALRVLVVAREQLNTERTAAINALNALVRATDLGIDARRRLTRKQITQITTWRARHEPVEVRVARTEAIRLARRIRTADTDLAANKAEITTLVAASPAATLLHRIGIGPITAAIIMMAWSHPGRVRDEAAFAALAGVNPIPASSGNTTRHRLNRHGDRRLNKALNTIVVTRMRHDPDTRAYAAHRTAQGRTTRDTKRILKRYIARQIFRALHQPTTA